MTPTIVYFLVGLTCGPAGCQWVPVHEGQSFASEQACMKAAIIMEQCTVRTWDDDGGPWDLLESSGGIDGLQFELTFGFLTKPDCEKEAHRKQMEYIHLATCIRSLSKKDKP